jgi:Leucine-rich repeat (LRR) protein
MTLKKEGKVSFTLIGECATTVDWGDGSPVDSVELKGYRKTQHHTYADTLEHVVKIFGDNITSLEFNFSNATKLDVSRCPTLTQLGFGAGKLTSLDVSKNTALEYLYCFENALTSLDKKKNRALATLTCSNNRFSASALNALFTSLPDHPGNITVDDNPGAGACDPGIAEAKGWNFYTQEYSNLQSNKLLRVKVAFLITGRF